MHHIITKDLKTPSTEHDESPTNTGTATSLLTHLHTAMAVNYGGLFTSTVGTKKSLRMWESLWTACFVGKNEESVHKTIRACFAKYSKPFVPADFNREYGQIVQPKLMYQHNTDALALPTSTWQERKSRAKSHIAKLKAMTQEDKQNEEETRESYNDDYFESKRGFLVYEPGQEKLKSYIGRTD